MCVKAWNSTLLLVNNKVPSQPLHPGNLISAFVILYLKSKITRSDYLLIFHFFYWLQHKKASRYAPGATESKTWSFWVVQLRQYFLNLWVPEPECSYRKSMCKLNHFLFYPLTCSLASWMSKRKEKKTTTLPTHLLKLLVGIGKPKFLSKHGLSWYNIHKTTLWQCVLIRAYAYWVTSRIMGRTREGRGALDPLHLENHKLLFVSLEILEWIPLKKQLDPMGPIAFWGRSVWPSVK